MGGGGGGDATRIEVVSTKIRPLRLRGGGAWQGLEGGSEGWGEGLPCLV